MQYLPAAISRIEGAQAVLAGGLGKSPIIVKAVAAPPP